MLPEEINAIKTGTIEFRTYEDSNTGFILTLVRMGKKSLTFEIVFDPTLYKDGRADISLYKKATSSIYTGLSLKTILYSA